MHSPTILGETQNKKRRTSFSLFILIAVCSRRLKAFFLSFIFSTFVFLSLLFSHPLCLSLRKAGSRCGFVFYSRPFPLPPTDFTWQSWYHFPSPPSCIHRRVVGSTLNLLYSPCPAVLLAPAVVPLFYSSNARIGYMICGTHPMNFPTKFIPNRAASGFFRRSSTIFAFFRIERLKTYTGIPYREEFYFIGVEYPSQLVLFPLEDIFLMDSSRKLDPIYQTKTTKSPWRVLT